MKRGGDVAAAVAGGLLLLPLLLALGALVRVSTGRPAVFRQVRSGRHGQEFEILKFRTMRDPGYPGEGDAPRITRLGRVLRTTGLDELPQLWNIVRGDMSIVGPRPTLPEQVARYSPRQRGRLLVRPGLTGWAQIAGRNALSWPERIELDLWYIANRSLRLDLRIMLRTVGVLLRRRGVTGAGGVNPGFPVSPTVIAMPHRTGPGDGSGPVEEAAS